MEQRIVIKSLLIVLAFFAICKGNAQTDSDYYTLSKGGKKYKKITGYIMMDKITKINRDEETITYYINNAILEHRKEVHKVDTCSFEEIKTYKKNSLRELGNQEKKELNRRLKEENIKLYPRPFHHRVLKIFLLEPIDCQNFKKIEVEWLYNIGW